MVSYTLLEKIPPPSESSSLKSVSSLQSLLDRYLSHEILHQELAQLPQSFVQTHPRAWSRLEWSQIQPNQVVNMPLSMFQSILIGCIETEAPIRGYTQTSRQYLEPLYPAMARYVGGFVAPNGSLLEAGVWEREERRHTPALLMIYRQLQGARFQPQFRSTRLYQPTQDPRWDLYRHGTHRIATEWGAVCLYLWLMTYTRDPLQSVLKEILQDEVGHLARFWGFGAWAYPHDQRPWLKLGLSSLQLKSDQSGLLTTFRRMFTVMSWDTWSWQHRRDFLYTCILVFQRMWSWQAQLSPDQLQKLLG